MGRVSSGRSRSLDNLTLAQAFRTALGQLLEYSYLLFPEPPHLIMFLDQKLDEKRLRLASALKIAVVFADDAGFVLLNADGVSSCLTRIFRVNSSSPRGVTGNA